MAVNGVTCVTLQPLEPGIWQYMSTAYHGAPVGDQVSVLCRLRRCCGLSLILCTRPVCICACPVWVLASMQVHVHTHRLGPCTSSPPASKRCYATRRKALCCRRPVCMVNGRSRWCYQLQSTGQQTDILCLNLDCICDMHAMLFEGIYRLPHILYTSVFGAAM